MIFEISHKTHYRYSAPVIQSQHLIHMTPRAVDRQTVRNHTLIIEPAPALRYEGKDAFGNPMLILDIEVPHKELVVLSRATIETRAATAIAPAGTVPWDLLDAELSGQNNSNHGVMPLEVVQYRCASRLTTPSREIAAYARDVFVPGRSILDGAIALNQRMFSDFKFDNTATDVSTPIDVVFKKKRGVCQDFAHVALACLRALRIPARYVSGYILTRPPPGQPRLQGADASHAWVSVWAPECGWVDFDPTNGVLVSDEHISIAYGRDYDDVSPISGVLLGGGEHTVSVAVDVLPVG